MKQYLSPAQTAKLIELGFEKPRVAMPKFEYKDGEPQFHYVIGELIKILPKEITGEGLTDSLSIYTDHNKMWTVEYSNVLGALLSTYRTELIDALYDMIVKLKEEGVI